MEKVHSAIIESNKKDWKRNKNNGDKHNSCGKNSNYNMNNKTDTKKISGLIKEILIQLIIII